MKIVADKALFDRWIQMKHDLQHQAGIVQNDMELPEVEALIILSKGEQLIFKLKQLQDDTRAHVMKNRQDD